MTKYIYFLVVIVFLSCSTEKKTQELNPADFDFSYTIDTVMVDAGNEFLFLNWGMTISSVSNDGKFLYNLNPQSLRMEVIDLDSLQLKETIQLEKEGPNGIGGTFYPKIQALDDGTICLLGMNKISIISSSGKLLKTIEFEKKQLAGVELNEDQEINNNGVLSGDGKLYAGTLANKDAAKGATGIVLINLETDWIKFIPMDLFRELKEFDIKFDDGNGIIISTGESFYLNFIEDDLIISSTAFNEVFQFSVPKDSLVHHTYNAQLTDNERKANFPTNVSSQKAWHEASEKSSKQVFFGAFSELPANEMILRVSRAKDRMIADSVVFKYVMTFFDADFNMLKEQEIENYHNSSRPFFKDGILYNFLNIDDELAFVRLKPTFTND